MSTVNTVKDSASVVTRKVYVNHKTYVQSLLGKYYLADMKTRQIVSKGYKSFDEALTHRY